MSRKNFPAGIYLLLTPLLAAGVLGTARAALVDPDPSFGTDGLVTTNISLHACAPMDSAASIAVDSTGRIVAGGQAWDHRRPTNYPYPYCPGQYPFGRTEAVARYLDDGTLDAAFSGDGKVMYTAPNNQANYDKAALEMTLDSSDRVLTAGFTPPNWYRYTFYVARYTTGGAPDPTFGSGGIQMVHFSYTNYYSSHAEAITTQPDDKIVVAGNAWQGGSSSYGIAIARLWPNGALDASFGTGGKVMHDLGSISGWPWESITSLAIDASDKIVAVGYAPVVSGLDMVVARFNADGTFDTSFDADGYRIVDLGESRVEQASKVILQPDGKILVSGSGRNTIAPYEYEGLLLRFNPDGSPDTGFGTDGVVRLDVGTDTVARDAVVQPDGSIMVVGDVSLAAGERDLFFAAYTADGVMIDHVIDDYGVRDAVTDMTVDSLGQLILSGAVDGDFAVWRYQPVDTDEDGVPDVIDNAPNDYNPDQSDLDGDGVGDVADPCPADPEDLCDPGGSAAESVGPDGGTVETPDGNLAIDIPAGALDTDTSISISDAGSDFALVTSEGQSQAVFSVSLGPAGTTFAEPVSIVFAWADDDDNGRVDVTNARESKLRISKDGVVITEVCPVDPGCDAAANIFEVAVTGFSEFTLIVPADADDDGFADDFGGETDVCADTAIPESVPTSGALGYNRWALTDEDGVFDTRRPRGDSNPKSFTIQDTWGCSCEQIIGALNLGKGQLRKGCSTSSMTWWVDWVNNP